MPLQNRVRKKMKRFNTTTQMPFIGALVLIFAYSLLLAIVPPSLTATTEIETREAPRGDAALPAEHIVTVNMIALPETDTAPSIQ